MNTRNTRRISNYIIDRGALARLSIPFLIMTAVSVTIVLMMRWKVMQALQSTELHGIENLPAMNGLLAMQNEVTLIGVVGSIVMALVCFILWIVFSHRIFGPTVPMRRHIQKLSEGDYTSRIGMRDSDELRDLAHDLNALAETLANKSNK